LKKYEGNDIVFEDRDTDKGVIRKEDIN